MGKKKQTRIEWIEETARKRGRPADIEFLNRVSVPPISAGEAKAIFDRDPDSPLLKDVNPKILQMWREAKMPRYSCRNCENALEAYRAINNSGKHAHLCRYCASLLDEKFLQENYERLGEGN